MIWGYVFGLACFHALLSWLICLVRGFGVAEGVEDHLLVCGDGRGEGLGPDLGHGVRLFGMPGL